MDLMHAVFISNNTGSNEEITFDEFYQVISKYHERQKMDKMLRNQ
jgi:Ca2+-binding EF-hand superfamily protein